MTHKTKGIVLKAVKYGETSLVVTILTELFGVQSYMVNGVRTAKRSGNKAAMFQPAAILELEVYHNEQKNLQRIKESGWALLYEHILNDVVINSIAMYMIELLQKATRQPEQNTDLFYFCEDALQRLDHANGAVAANFPLFFSLHLADFFGFRMDSRGAAQKEFLDLVEGAFTDEQPPHPHFLAREEAAITAELLNMRIPAELDQLQLNKQTRRFLLMKYQDYYALHIADFGKLKTLQILHEVL